jgi:membrane protein implicated in regulation of membrane protease activity
VAILAAASPSDPTGIFLQYGVVGAIAVVLALFAWRAYKRESDRGDRLEQQLQATNEHVSDRLAEVLGQTRDALRASNDYLRDLARSRR